MGVAVRRYIYFLILLIPTPLVSVLFFAAESLIFVQFFLSFFVLFLYFFVIIFYVLKKNSRSINTHTDDYGRPTAAI